MTAVLAFSCACVTCCSSVAGFTYPEMEADLHVSEEVCILSISLFVVGLGTGPREFLFQKNRAVLMGNPVFLGPTSEFWGRSRVLHHSFAWFFRESSKWADALSLLANLLVLNFPVALGEL